jgi:hyperosmotically inducible periplasmic protein
MLQEGIMGSRRILAFAVAGLLGISMIAPFQVRAQESAAHEEMDSTGSNAKNGEVGQAAKHLYRASRDETEDAAMTTQIKTALLSDKATRTLGIHVKSNQGLITLTGQVDSAHAAARAQSITEHVSGVQSVKNDLTWPTNAQ